MTVNPFEYPPAESCMLMKYPPAEETQLKYLASRIEISACPTEIGWDFVKLSFAVQYFNGMIS